MAFQFKLDSQRWMGSYDGKLAMTVGMQLTALPNCRTTFIQGGLEMKLTTRNIAGNPYTEYKVRAGETLKQIAKDQLRNETLTSGIYRLNNNIPEIKVISSTQNITGWILLLPPVPADLLTKNPAAKKKLEELKAIADRGEITAAKYYEDRRLILSVLN
jgi:hypothetical protein